MSNPLEKHQKDYKEEIWKQYSLQELGNWVHLFHKRSGHRESKEKAKKDLYDAKNYLWMMEQNLREKCKELKLDFSDL